jgi:hypothetical protein
MHLSKNIPGRMLGLSLRNVRDLVGYVSLYEFEDFICETNQADIVRVQYYNELEQARRVYKILKRVDKSGVTGSFLASQLMPKDSMVVLDRDYELFFPTFNSPFELFTLQPIQGWRDRSRYAACYINEVWLTEIQSCRYLLETLREFDHIFIGLHHAVEEVERIVGRPCTYLPIGIDALKFCPYPQMPYRSIDVCNIGRRSPITHTALMALEQESKIFYYYDTVSVSGVVNAGKQTTFSVKNPKEHRLLLANLLKRCNYFIANRAFVNDPQRTGGKGEIPGRYFEGAAAGTVMIGEAPRNDIFDQYFGWEDAVIDVPFDAPHIGEVIRELEAQPERVARIRRTNVINALQQHDWLHRLRVVYDTLGLPPTEAMEQRAAHIQQVVNQIHESAATVSMYI